MKILIIDVLAHGILILMTLVSSRDSDEPAYKCSLTRAFPTHIHKVLRLNFRPLAPLDMSSWAFKGGICSKYLVCQPILEGPYAIYIGL